MRCASWNEYRVTHALNDGITFDGVLLEQTLSQRSIQVAGLIVNRIVVRFQTIASLDSHLIQQVPDFIGISSGVNVPQGAG